MAETKDTATREELREAVDRLEMELESLERVLDGLGSAASGAAQRARERAAKRR